MAEEMYLWVRDIFGRMFPEIEHLTAASPDAEAKVKDWFARYVACLQEHRSQQGRSIGKQITAQSMKKHVVSMRNAIREIAPDHFALEHVGYDEATWAKLNLETFDRVEQRNLHMQFIEDPEAVVARAADMLGKYADWPKIAVGMAVAVGRRVSELLSVNTKFRPSTPYSLYFKGQQKHRGSADFEFEIATLVPAADVLKAWMRLREVLGTAVLSSKQINSRYGEKCNEAASAGFSDLVPNRQGKDHLYTHLWRTVYGVIAVHWFCPPRVNSTMYKAEIQGHTQIIDAVTEELRRSYASQRHYDDYRIADASGENIDGRQGIKLGRLPGLQVIAAFRSSHGVPVLPLPPGQPVPQPIPAIPEAQPTTMETPPTTKPINKKPARTKEEKPVCLRVYPGDFERVKALRLTPREAQQDTIARVLDMVERSGTEQKESRRTILKLTDLFDANHRELRMTAQELKEAQSRIEAMQAQYTALEERQRVAAPAVRPIAPQVFTGLRTIIRELDTLGRRDSLPEDVALRVETLYGMASAVFLRLADDSPLGQGAVQPTPEARENPVSEVSEPKMEPVEPTPLATVPSPVPSIAPLPPTEDASAEPPAAKVPPPTEPDPDATPLEKLPTPPSADAGVKPAKTRPAAGSDEPEASRRGITVMANRKIERAVKRVMAHNDAQTEREKRWVLTPALIERALRCYRPVVNRYWRLHEEEINAHNDKHGLTKGHNISHGRAKRKVEEIINAE